MASGVAERTQRLGRQGRGVLPAHLVRLLRPPDPALTHLEVLPSKPSDRTDPVSRFVHEHEGRMESPIDLGSDIQHSAILLLGEARALRIALAGPVASRDEAREGVPGQQEAPLPVAVFGGPVQHRPEKAEVVFDLSICRSPTAGNGKSASSRRLALRTVDGGPTWPSRRARMKPFQSPRFSESALRVGVKNTLNVDAARRSCPCLLGLLYRVSLAR